MTDQDRSRVAALILDRLDESLRNDREILERLAHIERQVAATADDVDALDRHNRPYGDGSKIRPRSRR